MKDLFDYSRLNKALSEGDLQKTKEILFNESIFPNQWSLEYAVESGNISLVNFLINNYKLKPNIYTMLYAKNSGNMELFYHIKKMIQEQLYIYISINDIKNVKQIMESKYNFFPDKTMICLARDISTEMFNYVYSRV